MSTLCTALLLAATALLTAGPTAALYCYVCGSSFDRSGDCRHSLGTARRDCDVCLKELTHAGDVIRQCLTGWQHGVFDMGCGSRGNETLCRCNDEDLCNGGVRVAAGAWWLLLIAPLVVLARTT